MAGRCGNDETTVDFAAHESFAFQGHQRLAQRCATQAQLEGKLRFVDPASGLEFTAQDALQELLAGVIS